MKTTNNLSEKDRIYHTLMIMNKIKKSEVQEEKENFIKVLKALAVLALFIILSFAAMIAASC